MGINKTLNGSYLNLEETLTVEHFDALNRIVAHWMRNKVNFKKAAQFDVPLAGPGALDPSEEYSLELVGHDMMLTLRVSNPDSVVYPRSEGWYLGYL